MSFSRYRSDTRLAIGSQFGVAKGISNIRAYMASGFLPVIKEMVLNGNDRLDTLAGSIYGNSSYWWVLAAASNIGWGLQVPPGTVIKIVDLKMVEEIV